MTEAERQETRKAMAFDLLQILKEKPEQTTYTAEEIKKLIKVYVKNADQTQRKGPESMTEVERLDAKKSMAYDLKLIFKEKQSEETFKQTEAIIDAYIAGMQQ